jgi:dsDNA-specific endonuclease/ATPase MutS2
VYAILGGTVADDDDQMDEGGEVWEITDELDLHTFRPRDVAELVPDYLDECVTRGYAEVRIIHGKGKGTLRRIVHAALERHPAVERFELAGTGFGSWGATRVWLRL